MLTMTAVKIAKRTGPMASEDMDHWRVTLHYNGKRMSLDYSMWKGFKGLKPRMIDVMGSCFIDYSASDSFEDFCFDFGYDTDLRKAKQTWKACRSMAIRLRKLMGETACWLLHDGEAVMAGSRNDFVEYIHKNHSYSLSHALDHEGYSIVNF